MLRGRYGFSRHSVSVTNLRYKGDAGRFHNETSGEGIRETKDAKREADPHISVPASPSQLEFYIVEQGGDTQILILFSVSQNLVYFKLMLSALQRYIGTGRSGIITQRFYADMFDEAASSEDIPETKYTERELDSHKPVSASPLQLDFDVDEQGGDTQMTTLFNVNQQPVHFQRLPVNLIDWIRSYLHNHKQYVKVNDCMSGILPVSSGVPQVMWNTPRRCDIAGRSGIITPHCYEVMFEDVASRGHIPETKYIERQLDPRKPLSASPSQLDFYVDEQGGDTQVLTLINASQHPLCFQFTPKELGRYIVTVRAGIISPHCYDDMFEEAAGGEDIPETKYIEQESDPHKPVSVSPLRLDFYVDEWGGDTKMLTLFNVSQHPVHIQYWCITLICMKKLWAPESTYA
ncbi:uncharacterized protein LOC119178666 [Rhipicephalus microplus]|uniref:uncharacterized protein LOC119178666 n=1 Tax=Rhipicephalus microplus TaxID=6941 RepID=UPI003F6B502B